MEKSSVRKAINELRKVSQKTNSSLFIVGGFVRDQIYNEFHYKKMNPKDIDLVCFDENGEFTKEMKKRGFQKHHLVMQNGPTYTYSGTIDGVEVDFAVKKEKFSVEKLLNHIGSFDFSCNSVALGIKDAEKQDYSKIISPKNVNSTRDIRNKKITIINKEKFGTNVGEPVRAIKLAEKLGFSINNADMGIIKRKLEEINKRINVFGKEDLEKLGDAFKTQANKTELKEKINKMINELADA